MANKKNDKSSSSGFMKMKSISQNISLLNRMKKDLYSDTYYSSKDNKQAADNLRDNIDTSIEKLVNNTYQNTSIGNISRLYNNLKTKGSDGSNSDIIKAMDIFNDQKIMDSVLMTWMQNKYIRDYDNEIDMILKYVPKLKEAMECKKDCVLSADHFAKDYLSFHNISSKAGEEVFNRRMKEIEKIYDLSKKFEEWVNNAQIYGEEFIAVLPYSSEFERMLKNKRLTRNDNIQESCIISENTFSEININQSTEAERQLFTEAQNAFKEMKEHSGDGYCVPKLENLTITFNNTGILINEAQELLTVQEAAKNNLIKESAASMFNKMVNESKVKTKNIKLDKRLVPDDLSIPDEENTASEMIIDSNEENDINIARIPGCVVKRLERADVLPMYVGDVCLGYYYFEFKNNTLGRYDDANSYNYVSSFDGLTPMSKPNQNDVNMAGQRNSIINYIAFQLANKINSTFINKNQELSKEIYALLKHNETFNSIIDTSTLGNINVNFLAADDVIHMKFKEDRVTHRGVSDLAYALFPAKLYSCLYITSVLGQITRGQDKRVYYVKQSVESNIAGTMLNVINQIKKGNFGARQMENLSNILNITGQFNDILIPQSPSGDTPVTMDIMPGQQFTDNSELMNRLEKMAVDTTDVPYDLIESRQSLDYAIQATMSNSKLMRNTFKRQDLVEGFGSDIITKIYNYQYQEMESIELTLPAPSFLNMTNGSQLIEGTTQYIEALINDQLPNESDEVKAEFRKLAFRYYLPTHIDINLIDRFINQAKVNVIVNRNPNSEEA